MKAWVPLAVATSVYAQTVAPVTQVPSWRSSISSLPASPPPNTTSQDVLQFEKNMRVAAGYLGNSTPNANTAQWEANRAMVRRMATYLAGLQTLSGDHQRRGAVTRAQRSFDSLGFAPYLAYVSSEEPPYPNNSQGATAIPESRQTQPPFDLSAPDLTNVNEADKDSAAELKTRYETDAAHSAGVWQNAETLRENLQMRGMGLNLETATAMVRLPQQFHSAAADLRVADWGGARTHLEQAEAVTEKIARTVGR